LSGAISSLVSPSTWTTSQAVVSSDPTHVSASGAGVPPGGFELSVTRLARAAQLTQTTALATAAADDQLTVQVGADPTKAFTIQAHSGDSLDTIAHAISSGSGTQVYASVVNSKLVLSSQVTGAANTFSVSSTGTIAADLGLSQTVTPQDATYSVDGGASQTSASNILTNVASGLTLTLLGTTPAPVSVTVSPPAPNAGNVQTAIQSFVTTYNATIDLISSKVNEAKVVQPQTDDDRAKGDLRGDPSLVSLLGTLRNTISAIVGGRPSTLQTLSQAGLSTGSAVGTAALSSSSIQGDLAVDATRLTSALTTNFDDVKALFTNATGSTSTQGLAQRLNGVLNGYVGTGGVISSAIASRSQLIDMLGKQKADWDVRLTAKEAALRAQYAQMESALQSAQSQGSWLTGQVASLPK
jgi:flagellar hook-associated protein 2